MFGLMQRQPLLVSSIIRFAARHHARTEIVSKTVEGDIHRTTYAEAERRARRLARALGRLGIRQSDRVGTLAWNGFRHLEIYYAVSGMGAVCHTINPRLSDDDIAYIITNAEDRVLFADTSFVELLQRLGPRIGGCVRAVVMMTDPALMPDLSLPAGIDLLNYEDLIAGSDDGFDWPLLDENLASGLCYTSGTTGRPKGVLYSHRSTLLQSYGLNAADGFGLRAVDRVMPVVPMFHVNAWSVPFIAPMSGAALVMPGRHLDGASLHTLMEEERVTMSAGVPTVWLGLLQHLRATGGRLTTLRRLAVGGSACPRLLFDAFEDEYGVIISHAWGMTEVSPVGTFYQPTAETVDLPREEARRMRLKQGRALFGLEMRIVDDSGSELPWDGKAFGNLMVRGPWVCERYFGDAEGGADAEGWFATGDVATIDPHGNMEIVDRTKDVVKTGGEWVSSIALENIAVSHPDVAEAAIIAAQHPKWQERPLLVVVPREGREIDPAAMREMFRGKVPDWWIPDAVLPVEEMPHTATGKIHKVVLRERFGRYFVPGGGS